MPTLGFCSPKVGLSLAKGLKLNSLTLGGQFRRWTVAAAFLLLIPLPLPPPPPLPTTLGRAARPLLCPQTTQAPVKSCEGLVADLSLVTLCSTLWKKKSRNWTEPQKGITMGYAPIVLPLPHISVALHQQWKRRNLDKHGGERGMMGWPCHKCTLLCPLRH